MESAPQPSLTRRSLASAGFRVSANVLAALLALGRAVVLARLLPVEAFGLYALAGALVAWSAGLGTLGMSAAILHRAPETRDEDRAAAVHFTLVAALSCLWAAVMAIIALAATTGSLRLALLTLIGSTWVANLAETPRALLVRRVEHRRLALLQVLATAASIAVAVPAAWRGGGVLALLAVDVVTSSVTVALLYLWRPVWRPRITWPGEELRYFLRFGARSALADLIAMSIVKLDKVWTGLVLGRTALGFYSRAFVFATYTQRTLFAPLNTIVGGSYAELAGDRARLSRAWLSSNAVLVRASCAAAGALGLAAPELIGLVLGARWLPMATAFRILLACTVLEPLRASLMALFVAVGRPGVAARIGFIQLAVLALGVFGAGQRLGIAGVAAALDVAVATGVVLLLLRARAHVTVAPVRLLAAPAAALLLGVAAGYGASLALAGSPPAPVLAATKIAAFAVTYAATLWAVERRWLRELAAMAGNG